MALEEQVIGISLGGSLDTKTDSKQVIAGDMLVLENSVFTELKKIRKRNGYEALAKTVTDAPFQVLTNDAVPATVASGNFLASFNNELILNDGLNLYSRLDSSSTWAYKGRNEVFSMTTSSVYKDAANQQNTDIAVNESVGLKLIASESYEQKSNNPSDFQFIRFSLVDIDTNQVLFNFVVNGGAGTESRPRCVSIGTKLYLLYYTTVGTSVYGVEVSRTGLGTPVQMITNIDTTNPVYDTAVINSILYVAYNGTGSTVKVASFNSTLAAISTTSKAETAPNGISVWGDPSFNVWVAYNNGIITKAFIMNSALAVTVLAPTVVDSGAGDEFASNKQGITGVYDSTNAKSHIFYDQPSVPIVTLDTTVNTDAGVTAPAVNASTTMSVDDDNELALYIGQTIYIEGLGYYVLENRLPGLFQIKNIGYFGNAAPATVVAAPKNIFATAGKIDAVTYVNTLTSAGTVGTFHIVAKSVALVSKAFMHSNVPHVIVGFDSNIQPTYFVASVFNTQANVITTYASLPLKVFAGGAGGIPNRPLLSSVVTLASGVFDAALTKRYAVETVFDNNETFFAGIVDVHLDGDPTQINPVVLGNNLHIPSGSLWMYDGLNVVEHGFNVFPESVVVELAGSGGFLDAGTYGWQVVYAWTDLQGNKHRSAPSAVVSKTVVASDLAEIIIPTLRLTEKTNVVIEIYRTTVNGTIYYLVGTALNTTANDTVSFFDGKQDDALFNNRQLYTTGEVQNNAVPATGVVASFKNRLVAIPLEEPDQYWYSKQVIPGNPVEFSSSFVGNIPETGGDTIAVAAMDDKLILGKSRNIYYVVGDGPAASGQNNDFTDPILVATDVGVIDRASVVIMPLGLMFKSSKGVYLLDRSLTVNYIGARVEDYNAYTVSSVELLDSVNQIRFMLSNGVAIVYDYFVSKWTVFTNHSSVSTTIANNIFHYLKIDGSVLKETAGVYSDNGSWITLKFTTSWLQLGSIQGFQRVWDMLIVGNYYGAHNLNVEVSQNFLATPTQTQLITGALVDGIYQYRVNFKIQKCESIQVTLYDSIVMSVNEGMDISALTFTAGIKKSSFKLGATKSHG
jgi:hypothetical protein